MTRKKSSCSVCHPGSKTGHFIIRVDTPEHLEPLIMEQAFQESVKEDVKPNVPGVDKFSGSVNEPITTGGNIVIGGLDLHSGCLPNNTETTKAAVVNTILAKTKEWDRQEAMLAKAKLSVRAFKLTSPDATEEEIANGATKLMEMPETFLKSIISQYESSVPYESSPENKIVKHGALDKAKMLKQELETVAREYVTAAKEYDKNNITVREVGIPLDTKTPIKITKKEIDEILAQEDKRYREEMAKQYFTPSQFNHLMDQNNNTVVWRPGNQYVSTTGTTTPLSYPKVGDPITINSLGTILSNMAQAFSAPFKTIISDGYIR